MLKVREILLQSLSSLSCLLSHLGLKTLTDGLQIISAHPPILCYNVADHLEPLLASLKEAGLQDPVQAIARRPSLLALKPDGSLARIIGYLQDTGKTQEEVAELLERSL